MTALPSRIFAVVCRLSACLMLLGCLGGPAYAQVGGPARGHQAGPQAVAPRWPSAANLNQPPQGFRLNAAQQQWLDQVLAYWETSSAKVKRFRCDFTRWEYNPTFVRDPNTPWTIAKGEIKYAEPDKGMYRVDKLEFYNAPPTPGAAPTYAPREGVNGEYWVCDGKSIFEFDYLNKHLIQRVLAPGMQGQAIADGPIPFLFGAKAEKLKQRYWLKPMVPPEGTTGEYWLAVRPKTRADAGNFELVEIILDQQQFLPKAMQIYLPGGKERKVFQFSGRKKNEGFRLFQRDFSKPDLPRGWKKVVDDPAARRTASQIPVPRR